MSSINITPNNDYKISMRANNITSNFGDNLVMDASGNSNLVIMTDSSNVAVFGPNTISGTTYNKSLNVNGPYFSNSVSALRIPADSSNNRPTGQTGYIRYNTDTNLIEYWNGNTSSWEPISPPTPVIGSISPQYILQDVSSTVYTISGGNFNSTSNVSFIGNVDSITYPSAVTTFNSTIQLTCLITDDIADASNNTAFAVKVTNTNSGFSATSGSVVLYNKGPIWNTLIGSNLGTGLTDFTYTTGDSPFTDLSASDVPPVNSPISYFTSTPLNASAPLVTLDSTLGRLIGTMPSVSSISNYNFNSYPQDASGSRGPNSNFIFSVAPFVTPSAGLTSYMTTTYVDSGNNIVSGPVSGGAVIYTFKDSSATSPGTTRTGTITVNIARTLTYLVVAGGGGGGGSTNFSGGGGAGGLLTGTSAVTASSTYPLTVGAGGTYDNNGSNSVFSGITANGGGAGGGAASDSGNSGGSGGGGAGYLGGGGTISNWGTGTGGQGNRGGGGGSYPSPYGDAGGGGGGAGAVGGSQNNVAPNCNDGGIGVTSTIQGLPATYYAGGGGGRGGNGGLGGGGGNNGGTGGATQGAPGTNGLGGGGQGGGNVGSAGNGSGGSGVVILRFPI